MSGRLSLKRIFSFFGSRLPISKEDIGRVVVQNKAALDKVKTCETIDELFTPHLWKGYSTEMEDLWYTIPRHKRPNLDFLELRSKVASLEGRELREDQLQRIGISVDEAYYSIRGGNVDYLKTKLEKRGDHLCLDDALLCDQQGDHALSAHTAWDHFDTLYDAWESHDDIPDAAFFLRKRAGSDSIVDSAFRYNKQDKIFNDHVFAGRPDELAQLYDALSPGQQKRVDIDVVLGAVIEKICADYISLDDRIALSDLTALLYAPENGKRGPHIIGLGLEKVWDNIDDVRSVLRKNGERLTLDHLRLVSGGSGETCMFRAASCGAFDKVLDILEESCERLALDDLLLKNGRNKNVLDILAESGQIEQILKPSLWAGRVQELGAIWRHTPGAVRDEKADAFQETHSQANLMSLRAIGPAEKPASSPSVTPTTNP